MTRKRRYLIVAGILAGCVCAALGVVAMLPPQPGVTKANFDRIEIGMTKSEVEQIFGRERTVSPSPFRSLVVLATFQCDFEGVAVMCWDADNGSWAGIGFKGNCVVDKHWRNSPETFTDKFRRWLHLPK